MVLLGRRICFKINIQICMQFHPYLMKSNKAVSYANSFTIKNKYSKLSRSSSCLSRALSSASNLFNHYTFLNVPRYSSRNNNVILTVQPIHKTVPDSAAPCASQRTRLPTSPVKYYLV